MYFKKLPGYVKRKTNRDRTQLIKDKRNRIIDHTCVVYRPLATTNFRAFWAAESKTRFPEFQTVFG